MDPTTGNRGPDLREDLLFLLFVVCAVTAFLLRC